MAGQLLDQYGRPVKRAALKARVAEPGVTSIRSAWAGAVAGGMTPEKLAGILQAAAQNALHDYLILAEEMEERDLHYASVLGVRKRKVSGAEAVVKPASDDPADQKIAEDVRASIAEHDGFSDLASDLLDAIGKGYSVVEIDWRGRGARWEPEFIHRDPRFFTFDRDQGRELRLLDEAAPVDGLELMPFKFIVHRSHLKSGLTARAGLARLVAFGWMCKAYTVKDWVAFAETYGMPLRIGRYHTEATPADVQELFKAVANIGTDAAAVLPEGMMIEFVDGARGSAQLPFEPLARWVDEQVSKAVLGQTMTSDDGSSMAQANVHNEVRLDIAIADARALSATLHRDLVIPFVDLNYGVQRRYPRLKIVIEEPEDTDLIMRNAARMVALGLRLKAGELRQKLGFSDPGADDEVIGGAGPNAAAPAERAANRETAEDAEETPPDEDWQDVMGDLIGPLLTRLEAASGFDEARRIIAGAFPGIKDAALIEKLVLQAFEARAAGEMDDG